MKAVNLLPERHRPRQASGGRDGSAWVVLGVLGVVVVAVLLYVLTANSINSAKSDIAEAKADTERANAQAGRLGPYGNFAKVKEQRVEAVKDLADSRVDWERLMRELARVLPDGVWIQSADASDGTGNDQTAAAPASTGGTGAPATPAGPQVTLTGCAPDQPTVAETLVRLRTLQGATDVTLEHSTRPDEKTSGATGGGSTGGGSSSATSAGSGGCGESDGRPNYDFQIDVTLDAHVQASSTGKVPASLGGGQ